MTYATCQTAAVDSGTLQTSVSKNAELKSGRDSTAVGAILGIGKMVGLVDTSMDGQ